MRLRRRKFHATVSLSVQQPGDAPIVVIGFGVLGIEATVVEARQLALDLADAVDAAGRGDGDDSDPPSVEVSR